ncbi:MAG: helix-turn-helix domain-containing protein [Tissierellaceae bacterium]|nr:helix-turn-helix domain-containing protein [Tissierellaceae bacterium]
MSNKKIYKTPDELPLFLSIKDLSDILGISEPKAREIACSDGFPIISRTLTGKRIVIPKMAFLNWAEQNMVFDYKDKTNWQ